MLYSYYHPWKSFIPTHIMQHIVIQKAPHFPNKLLLTFWLSITCGCRGGGIAVRWDRKLLRKISYFHYRTTSNSRKVTQRRKFLLWSQSINCEMRDSIEVLFWLCWCDRNCQCAVAWCGAFGQAYALQEYQSGQELQWNC